jgi:hypothetical protein
MVYVSYKQFDLHTEYAECSAFSPVVGIGPPPTPRPQASVPPLPPVLGGGAHSLAREGLGEPQFRRGDIHCDTLYIYVRTLWIYPSKRVSSYDLTKADRAESSLGSQTQLNEAASRVRLANH